MTLNGYWTVRPGVSRPPFSRRYSSVPPEGPRSPKPGVPEGTSRSRRVTPVEGGRYRNRVRPPRNSESTRHQSRSAYLLRTFLFREHRNGPQKVRFTVGFENRPCGNRTPSRRTAGLAFPGWVFRNRTCVSDVTNEVRTRIAIRSPTGRAEKRIWASRISCESTGPAMIFNVLTFEDGATDRGCDLGGTPAVGGSDKASEIKRSILPTSGNRAPGSVGRRYDGIILLHNGVRYVPTRLLHGSI